MEMLDSLLPNLPALLRRGQNFDFYLSEAVTIRGIVSGNYMFEHSRFSGAFWSAVVLSYAQPDILQCQ